MSSSKENRRIEAIDIAKGIGILLVVFVHDSPSSLCNILILSFLMPLFFILSGLCFNESKWTSFSAFLYKRVKGLIFPLAFFLLLRVIINVIIGIIGNDNRVGPGALWFLWILFSCELIYYLISKIKYITIRISIVLICLCIALVLYYSDMSLPFNIVTIFIAIFYYGFGNLMKSMLMPCLCKSNMFCQWIIGPVLFMLTVGYTFFSKTTLDISRNVLVDIPTVLLSVMGTVGFLFMCTINIGKLLSDIFSLIGRNTIVILSVHQLFVFGFRNSLKHYFDNLYIYWPIEISLVLMLSLVSCYVVKRYLPFVLGK